MNKEAFNKYCADVMGYTFAKRHKGSLYFYFEKGINNFHGCVSHIYNPHDDLNQASEVFDKLMSNEGFLVTKYFTYDGSQKVKQIPIKTIIHDFIIYTMPEAKK